MIGDGVLLHPPFPRVAPKHGRTVGRPWMLLPAAAFNLMGLPATADPARPEQRRPAARACRPWPAGTATTCRSPWRWSWSACSGAGCRRGERLARRHAQRLRARATSISATWRPPGWRRWRRGSARRRRASSRSRTRWCWPPRPPTARPSARTVLLKGLDERGLVFFTNLESRKGSELAENPRASVAFTWLELQRQIRADGRWRPSARRSPTPTSPHALTAPSSALLSARSRG